MFWEGVKRGDEGRRVGKDAKPKITGLCPGRNILNCTWLLNSFFEACFFGVQSRISLPTLEGAAALLSISLTTRELVVVHSEKSFWD